MEDEEKKPDLTEGPEKNETTPEGAISKEPVRFSLFDWLAVLLGVALAVLWFHVFDLESLINVPGLGTTAFVLAALASEVVVLRGRARPSKQGIFLVACTVLLAAATGLFGEYSVRMVNLALLACLTPASALALAGRDFPALTVEVIPETLRLFIPNLFRHFIKPFQALRRRDRSFNGFWVVMLSLLIAFPLLALVVALLSSADQVFDGLLGDIGVALLNSLDRGKFLWTWLKCGIFGLMLFSFLYSLARPAPKREETKFEPLHLPCLPFIAVLSALDVIYAVFAVIQFVFLFGGAETAAMQGGFAQYARQGFFQLVAVAGINLLAALSCGKAEGKGKRFLKALVFLLIGLTFVILVSAVFRMCLYIGAYGLSLLRCATLLIMLWIAVSLGAVAWKTVKPDFRVFPVFLSSFLVLWLAFNYVDIASRIRDYNLAAFESGALSDFDEDYVSSLAPDEERNASLPWQNKVLFPMSDP